MNYLIEYQRLKHPFGTGDNELRIEYNQKASTQEILEGVRQALELSKKYDR